MNTVLGRSNWSQGLNDASGCVFRNFVIALVTAIGMVAGFDVSAFAQAVKPKPNICATTITTCGCQINKKGLYKVTADLKSSDGLTLDGDCIEVASSNVILNLGNHSITGPGGSNSDVGIDVKHGSNNDTIVGGGSFATISGLGRGSI